MIPLMMHRWSSDGISKSAKTLIDLMDSKTTTMTNHKYDRLISEPGPDGLNASATARDQLASKYLCVGTHRALVACQ